MKAIRYLATMSTMWCLLGGAVLEGRNSDRRPSSEWVKVKPSQEPIVVAFPKKPTHMQFALPFANTIPEKGSLKVLCTEEGEHTFFVCTLQGEEGTFHLTGEQLQKTFRDTIVPYLFYDRAPWGEVLEVRTSSCCRRPALSFRATSQGEWMRGLTFLESGQVQHLFFLIGPKEQWDDLAANTFLESIQSEEQ